MPRRAIPHPTALRVGLRIRKLRLDAGYTLEQLAVASDVISKGHLSSLERGLVMPTVATLEAVARALSVLSADLLVDPEAGSMRERVIDETRHLGAGALRRLARELSSTR